MTFDSWPDSASLLDIFTQTIHQLGGEVKESFTVGNCLYARSILPDVREASSRDQLKGGVALRATDTDVRVHPYVYRLVCSNGAIFAQAVQTTVIERDGAFDPITAVELAVRECASPQAFARSTQQMRGTMKQEIDLLLSLMPALSRLPNAEEFLRQIMKNFARSRDRSGFGILNAVTATARETGDPEMRWRLEELGGAIAAGLPDPRRHPPVSSRKKEPGHVVAV